MGFQWVLGEEERGEDDETVSTGCDAAVTYAIDSFC